MRKPIEVVIGIVLLFILLAISSASFDAMFTGYFGGVGRSASGVPFVFHVYVSLPPIEPGDPSSYVRWNIGALAIDAGIFAAIAIVSVILTRRRSSSSHPIALTTAIGDSSERTLRRRGAWCLLVTVVGSVLGIGLFAGPVGWWWGRRLCLGHGALERRPGWAATAAWTAGRAMTVAMLVCALGLAIR